MSAMAVSLPQVAGARRHAKIPRILPRDYEAPSREPAPGALTAPAGDGGPPGRKAEGAGQKDKNEPHCPARLRGY